MFFLGFRIFFYFFLLHFNFFLFLYAYHLFWVFLLFFLLFWSLISFRLELMAKGKRKNENVNKGQGSKLKMSKCYIWLRSMDVKKGLGNGANGNKGIYLCHEAGTWGYLIFKHVESWDHGEGVQKKWGP